MLVASQTAFAIIGYDMNDEPHELMNMQVDEEEEIVHISFVEDESPQSVLMMTYDYNRECTVSRILNIKQENVHKFEVFKKDFEH